MRCLPFILFSVLFPLCAFCTGQGELVYERRPAMENYLDHDTGVTLPARIGRFRKTEVVKNFNPLIGTVIRYSDTEGNCADVYIYSLTASEQVVLPNTLRAHFDETCRAIINLPKKSSQVAEVIFIGEKKLDYPPVVAGYSASFRINIVGDFRNSELALFSYGNRVVKIRISSSPYAEKDENFNYFTKDICAAFNALKKP